MLSELCQELKNWFTEEKYIGEYKISGGVVTSLENLGIKNGQYYRVVGSIFNDGVYKYPNTDLIDEDFHGAIWLMRVPKEIVDLSNEISTWVTDNAGAINSPFQSESFGGYSYTKASSDSNLQISWQSHFAPRLNKWRKIR